MLFRFRWKKFRDAPERNADTSMSRFDRAGRDAPAGCLPDSAGGQGERLNAKQVIRLYELERRKCTAALGPRSRWNFEDHGNIGCEKQSAFSRDKSRAYNETGGVSRWQARATYGDGGEGPVDGIWPPPMEDTSRDDKVGTSESDRNQSYKNGASTTSAAFDDPREHEHLSRTALKLKQKTDQFYASIAAKGPRQVLGPGVHENRWQQRADEKTDPTSGFQRSPADAHAGRHEERAFYGDGGGKNKVVSQKEKDKNGGASNDGRWEERGKFHDANYHLEMPNGGHYARWMSRDVWENGGYLKLPKGIHERGYTKEGVWDDGLWERRGGWAYEGRVEQYGKGKPSRIGDPTAGPNGQRPIGPMNKSKTLEGVWEQRGDVHRDTDGFPLKDVGVLGHVRRGADTHAGRWEQRHEWGKERIDPKLEHKSDEHAGRWENRGRWHKECDGIGGGEFYSDVNPTAGGPREPPAARAARIAQQNRAFVNFRDKSNDPENDMNRVRGFRGDDQLLVGSKNDKDENRNDENKPTWFGDTPVRNIGLAEQSVKGVKENVHREKQTITTVDGVFAGWMANGRNRGNGYTRTPEDLRDEYDAMNEKHGARKNHGRERMHENLEGDLRNVSIGDAFSREGGSMVTVRNAIKAASSASSTRKDTQRRHLGSHVGVI